MNKKIKLIISIIFFTIAILFVYLVFKGNYINFEKHEENSKSEKLTREKIFTKLYETEFVDYQDNKVNFKSFRLEDYNKIIVHFWASWCGPCVSEVPELIAYSKKNPDVKFIIISVDEYKDDIAKFLISFPDFNSEKYIRIWGHKTQISTYLDVDRLPMSIVLRKDKSEPQFIRAVVDWKHISF